MKKNILFSLFTILFSLTLVSCSGSDDESTDEPDVPQTYRRSVIIYIAAQNSLGYLESGYTSASRLDSLEIMKGMAQLNSTKDNVFLFIDDSQRPRLSRIYRYGGGGQMRTMVSLEKRWSLDVCSTDPATLHEVLSYVATNYPSESYGLILWSHGSGWQPSTNVQNTLKLTKSFGIDVGGGGNMETDTDSRGRMGVQMDISDMATAIARSGVHLDYIFFDACNMQNIEVAYELKDVTSYVIGSATTTSAYGAYYTDLIPQALFAYPMNDANAMRMARQYFFDATQNVSLQDYYEDLGNVNSVIKTSELENFAAVTGQYIGKAITNRQTVDMTDVQRYSDNEHFYSPAHYDMGCVLGRILSAADYQAWRAEADKCIISHNATDKYILYIYRGETYYATLDDPDHIVGVSMFVPDELYDGDKFNKYPFNKDFQSTAWYKAANWKATGW
ncbi:MAG: hypothetical protein J6129_08040 [Bacteroidaceae bacterium]|nr:hypothetical protein [Bacteroidaceae bacterium]